MLNRSRIHQLFI